MLNWFFHLSFYSSFENRDEDQYAVAYGAPAGKAFLLNEDQFQDYERWLITKMSSANKDQRQAQRSTIDRVMFMAPLVTVTGALIMMLLHVISMPIAMVIVLVSALVYGLAWRKESRRVQNGFPFPDAPQTDFLFSKKLKRTLIATAAAKSSKLIAWVILIVGGLPFVGIITIMGFVLVLSGPGIWDDWRELSLIATAFAFQGIFLGLALAILIIRRKFKKRTGHEINFSALYLDELGRDLSTT